MRNKIALSDARKIIERTYQRAMNIRDSVNANLTNKEEEDYARAYRRAYRNGDSVGFTATTRKYLNDLRKAIDNATNHA